MRSEVECRAYTELHSALSQVMRYSESRQNKGAQCKNSQLRKAREKKTQSKISVTISLLHMLLVQLLCWLQSLVQ